MCVLLLQGNVSKTLDLISKIVGSIKKSTIDSALLPFKIPMMNSPQWSSQYAMLVMFLKASEAEPAKFDQMNSIKTHGKPTATDMKIVKELVYLLGPFKEFTDVMQREFECIGFVIPEYDEMRKKLSRNLDVNPRCSNITFCRTVMKILDESLEKRLAYVLNDKFYILDKFNLCLNMIAKI